MVEVVSVEMYTILLMIRGGLCVSSQINSLIYESPIFWSLVGHKGPTHSCIGESVSVDPSPSYVLLC